MENDNDVYTAVKVKVVTKITTSVFSFTRADVVTKLMEFAAAAANVFGPFSKEVWDLENDIDCAKNGGDLAAFTWCFPQMADFEKEVVE